MCDFVEGVEMEEEGGEPKNNFQKNRLKLKNKLQWYLRKNKENNKKKGDILLVKGVYISFFLFVGIKHRYLKIYNNLYTRSII